MSITIAYSTRKKDENFIEHLKKTAGNPKIEILTFENPNGTSLAKIYNEALEKANNNIIVFTHDDIIFETKNWCNKLLKLFTKNPEYAIIGLAGTTDLIDGRWWTLKESMNGIVSHQHEGKRWTNQYSTHQGNKITEMVVLDGLFFGVE